MEARQDSGRRVPVLRLSGPLDGLAGHRLQDCVRACLAEGRRSLILDLAQVPRVDASGLGRLLSVLADTRLPGGVLRLAAIGCDDLNVVTKLLVEFEASGSEAPPGPILDVVPAAESV